jgi:hypothetical protein
MIFVLAFSEQWIIAGVTCWFFNQVANIRFPISLLIQLFF